jgi:hypothetical protein
MKSLPQYIERQPGLPLSSAVCEVCRYHAAGRCDAIPTRASYLASGEHLIGCLDIERQSAMSSDLYGRFVRQCNSNQENLQLPAFIPAVTDGLGSLQGSFNTAGVAIYLTSLLKKSGQLRFDDPERMREHFGLPYGAKVGLVGVVDDRRLERLWHTSDASDVWRRLAQLDFDWTTSFSYSAWEDMPKWDQIYNIDRGLVTHDLLSARGIPTIPFVLFDCTARDREDSLAWLERRPDVQTVAVLTQCRKTGADLERVLDEMSALHADLSRSVQFLVVGPSTPRRIQRVMERFPTAKIVTEGPFQKALHGKEAIDNLGIWRDNYSDSRELLFARTAAFYAARCSEFSEATRR